MLIHGFSSLWAERVLLTGVEAELCYLIWLFVYDLTSKSLSCFLSP